MGSVKSLIGHTKCAAGLGRTDQRVARALSQGACRRRSASRTPNPKLDLREGPFRLCTQTEPWLHPHADRPRRAGVSAFGFGGTNFHAVLEAYDRSVAAEPEATVRDWPAELLVWQADDSRQLVADLDCITRGAGFGRAARAPRPVAHADPREDVERVSRSGRSARDPGDRRRVARRPAREAPRWRALRSSTGRTSLDDPRGVFFEATPPHAGEPVAFVFPGQGAQSPGMLRELAVLFPEVREAFEEFDRACLRETGRALGPLLFTPAVGGAAERDERGGRFMATDVAQPAVGAACVGMLRLLRSLGCAARRGRRPQLRRAGRASCRGRS